MPTSQLHQAGDNKLTHLCVYYRPAKLTAVSVAVMYVRCLSLAFCNSVMHCPMWLTRGFAVNAACVILSPSTAYMICARLASALPAPSTSYQALPCLFCCANLGAWALLCRWQLLVPQGCKVAGI
jgi:hypothetical protein